MKRKQHIFIFLMIICVSVPGGFWSCAPDDSESIKLGLGMMSGEVTQTSVILQARSSASDTLIDNDLPGADAVGYFEVSPRQDFGNAQKSEWLQAVSEFDYILKTRITDLAPNTTYYYRLIFGPNKKQTQTSSVGVFTTLQTAEQEEDVSFVVVTGMNYARHFYGRHDGHRKSWQGYDGPDRELGFPAIQAVLDLQPDFFIGTGDNVYYDRNSPGQKTAETQEELRQRWHEQFIQPRFIKLFANVPTYWEKDDHDHRYNDSDTTNTGILPSHKLGVETFLEQIPVVAPTDQNPKTYRTHRINKHLQLWFTEGRDYRSPNDMPDGPQKTMWGKEQKEWLKRTLLESDATYKILVTPTSLVGPDDWGSKCDNHLNCYRYERAEFFDWLEEHNFDDKNFIIICGDRHWQYHAIDPTGIHEYGTGAFVDGNARLGVESGDPNSTDPDGLIIQPYLQPEPSGGFLHVSVKKSGPVIADFSYYDENKNVLYSHSYQTDP